MADKIACSTCFYWVRKDNSEGECRAVPPVPILTPLISPLREKTVGVMAFFPATREEIWCGQHSGRARMEDLMP